MADNLIVPIDKAPASPPVPTLGPVAPQVVPAVSALGGRAGTVAPNVNLQLLGQACVTPRVLRNAGHSPGASPLLKELLLESGYPHQVTREVYGDGGQHQVGNAIDLTSDDLGGLCRFLRRVPQLFTVVVYRDDFPDESLYILDGVVVTSASFPEQTGTQIHMATTVTQFGAALKLRTVRAAFEVAVQHQFTNRDVYAMRIPDIGGQVNDPAVRFW